VIYFTFHAHSTPHRPIHTSDYLHSRSTDLARFFLAIL
jgi:hypothetical protein